MRLAEKLKRRLKLRDLDALMVVAREGSMRKAAELLHMSQPAVSKAIADLEAALGVPLFDRSPQGVTPTLYGRAVMRRGVAIFDELEQSAREIEFLADPGAGELRLGCSETVAAGLVSAAIDRLTRRYPRISFRMESAYTPALHDHFLRERIGELVIVRPYAATPPADFNVEPLWHERLKVVVGSNSPWARRRKVTLADLAQEPWVLSQSEAEPASPMVQAFQAIGAELPHSRVLTGSLNSRLSLLATARFVTVMPDSLLAFGVAHLPIKVLSIVLPRWEIATSIVTLKDRTLSPVASLFIDCARDLARQVDLSR
ncbi:LysR family transcriptional regulator [Polaromonas jejuensis]|uniref:LysR family transcriptional regulator n=1 Tax=Polaromonas jejuensis TaxID=457502 RepID=A0ABW0QFI7_9BURK|nr:LysR family transcriptional regulator [Polaromonas jejuensis]